MHIAIVITEFPTLSETFISNQVKYLARLGNELIVFCNNKNERLFRQLFSDEERVTLIVFSRSKLVSYMLLHPNFIIQFLSNKRKAKESVFNQFKTAIVNKERCDIIHFEFSGIGIEWLKTMPLLKGKKVVSCRGSAEKVKLLKDKNRQEKTQQLFDAVDAVHCVSGDMRNTILPYCSNPGKIFINFPSIEVSLFKRSNEYVANETPVILSVGRFTFQKGYLTGLLTINRLKNAGMHFKWMIIGGGPQEEEIVFHINQLQLQEHVFLLGSKSRDEVQQWMQQADIYFLPSFYEGIANVVLEAMSMELPVVSTKSGGMDEVITHNENGLLADVYDDTSLAKHLLMLLKDFAFRQRIGKAARERVLAQFDIHQQADKFQQVYQHLITGKS